MKPRWILALAAGLLFVTGIACRVWVGQLSEQHDKIERLPVLHAPDFRKAKPGAEVLVLGTLSYRNPLLVEDLVCMITYRSTQTEKTVTWSEEARRTPPIWLNAQDGEVHLVNANYRLEANAAARKVDAAERGPRYSHLDDANHATTGFGRGDPVLAFGKVVSSEGVAEMEATWLYSGNRENWLDESAHDYRVAQLVPWTLWVLALVFGALAFLRH